MRAVSGADGCHQPLCRWTVPYRSSAGRGRHGPGPAAHPAVAHHPRHCVLLAIRRPEVAGGHNARGSARPGRQAWQACRCQHVPCDHREGTRAAQRHSLLVEEDARMPLPLARGTLPQDGGRLLQQQAPHLPSGASAGHRPFPGARGAGRLRRRRRGARVPAPRHWQARAHTGRALWCTMLNVTEPSLFATTTEPLQLCSLHPAFRQPPSMLPSLKNCSSKGRTLGMPSPATAPAARGGPPSLGNMSSAQRCNTQHTLFAAGQGRTQHRGVPHSQCCVW